MRVLTKYISETLLETFLQSTSFEKQKTTTRQDSVTLEATLAPAEAEVGAVAKADQKNDTLTGV